MTRDTITALPDPNGFSTDPLTDLIRKGARQLIEQALEAALDALLSQFANETTEEGHARVVRHGHLPEREVMTGVAPVAVKVPRVRDRGQQAEKTRFSASILPPYLRKAKSIEELLPWLYLKGISTGDFQEALAALLGPNAAALSSTTISRRKADWWDDYERWQKRDLGARCSVTQQSSVAGFTKRVMFSVVVHSGAIGSSPMDDAKISAGQSQRPSA